ncbi:MAG: hypothetical protein NTW87_24085 [Planctomycetota bacterium]|nr:hypothetical protein [Planctomycetota bacterium]
MGNTLETCTSPFILLKRDREHEQSASRHPLTALLLAPLAALAAITPASLFTDNAVLQQKLAIAVWGKADPNEPITVSINGQSASTTAGADGKWSVRRQSMADRFAQRNYWSSL